MRKIKLFTKMLAMFLAFILAVEVLPFSTLAEEISEWDFGGSGEVVEEDTAEIQYEVEENRTEYTKHFRLTDGSYIAASYNEPVHYEKNGKWAEIDNTLVLQEIDGKNYYVNKESDEKIMLPQKFEDGGITIESSTGHTFTLSPVDSNNNSILKTQLKDIADLQSAKSLDSEVSFSDEKMSKMAVDNISSGIKYYDVFDNADLEYIVTSSRLKESIVVNEKADRYSYSFTADFDGLMPVTLGNGAIGLFDKANLENGPIALVEAPYMYDANGVFSDDVTVNITNNGNTYTLTVVPDLLWMNSAERKFPIVIDPTLRLDIGRNDINDTYVDIANPSGSSAVLNYDYFLYIGKNGLGKTRTYVKFNLPTLPESSVVTGAMLSLVQYEYDPGTGAANYIYAYDCGDNTWESATINWNNQPMSTTNLSSDTVLDYNKFVSGITSYMFDVTKAAKRWFESGVNNGLMLASADETVTTRSRFCSSDMIGLEEIYYPSIYVAYLNNRGLEDYWTYQTVDLGTSGTVYVNDYSGALTYIHNDVSTAGNRMTASVSHVYTDSDQFFSGSYGNMKFGKGFRPSMFEKIEYAKRNTNIGTSDNPLYQMEYVDADGTVHYFTNNVGDTEEYKHEFNDKLTLKKTSSGYEMRDDSGNIKYFSGGGYLLKNQDANGNYITINYTSSQILNITDAVGKKITFTYDSNGYLTKITDPAGRATLYTYSDGYLTKITYPDGKTTTFTYSSTNNLLSQITTFDTSTLEIALKNVNNSNYKVASLTKKSKLESGSREIENKLTYQYNSGETVITDNFGNKNYIVFDNAGRTVNVRDQEGNASYAKYNDSGNKRNTLSVSSDTFASINNMILNGDAEFTSNVRWGQNISGTDAAGTAVITDEEKYVGSKSFKVSNTSGKGRVAFSQAQTLVPGKTYTFSAQVKINSAITGNGGASLGLTYQLTNGTWKNVFSEFKRGVQDWHRESFTFEYPLDAVAGTLAVLLTVYNSTGTAYFDCIQIEEGRAMNRYNLLSNSGFETVNSSNQPLYWTTLNAESNDGITNGIIGDKGYRIYGNPSKNKYVSQEVLVNGKNGDTIVIGGWTKASASGKAPTDDNKNFFHLTAKVCYNDGTYKYIDTAFCRDINMEQYVCGNLTATQDFDKVIFYFSYYKEVNNAVFDGACMYLDNYGSSYSYDDDGRLTSTADGTGNGISYTYDGPNVTKISQKFDGEIKESCEYTYDDFNNVLTETTKGGVVTEYLYKNGENDTYGMPTKTTVRNADGTVQSYSTMEYTSNYNFLTKVTDSRDGVTLYDYNVNTGNLNSVTDPNGNVTTYTYDANTGALLSTTGNANASTSVTNSYGYTDYALTSITHNGFNYGFTYDKFGRSLSNTVAGRTLITNSYNTNGTLASSTYGNGAVKSYSYDSLDRISAESYNGNVTYEYDYNKENLVYAVRDYETPNTGYVETKYDYDLARRITGVTTNDGQKANYVYDERSNIKSMTMTVNGETVADASYTYKADGLVDTSNLPLLDGTKIAYEHDALNRTTKRTVSNSSPKQITTNYTYISNDDNQTGLVSQIQYNSYSSTARFDYTYDANGNIKTVTVDNVLQSTYTYDGLNQLIRHDDAKANKSYTYTYDNGGNILSKSEYAYTTGALGTTTKTIPYVYNNSWKDLLTSYNGKTITYDQIGNPLSYNGNTYTWQKGRQLASIENSDYDIEYRYNSNGQRTKKIVNGVTTEYYYSGDLLVAQYDGTYWLKFMYSADGDLVGYTDNGIPYYYIKNIQGDVIKVVNRVGYVMGSYNYDAWGNLISIDYNWEDEGDVARRNPIRYRGYYYDTETKLYYLNSRYYSAEMGRFLNADGYASTGQGLTGSNMFTYCGNNPINMLDVWGMDPVPIWAIRINDGTATIADYEKAFHANASQWSGGARYTVDEAISIAKEQYPILLYNEHQKKGTTNPSNRAKHENGQARKQRDQHKEKADKRRKDHSNKRRHNMDALALERVGSAVVVVGATVGVVYLIANDVTGVGVIDNAAIVSLVPIIWDNASKVVT